MNRLGLFLLLGTLASLATAASATTFCKCTCFTNSTIIELKSQSSTSGSSHSKQSARPSAGTSIPDDDDDDGDISGSITSPDTDKKITAPSGLAGATSAATPRLLLQRAQTSPTCTQCNRAFCLSQSLPICKGAAEKDVVTMCFQRDLRKDQIIVWAFMLGTAGLLGWAALRKLLELQQGFVGFLGAVGGRGNRDATTIGSRFAVSSGSDIGRGTYVDVASHNRNGSMSSR